MFFQHNGPSGLFLIVKELSEQMHNIFLLTVLRFPVQYYVGKHIARPEYRVDTCESCAYLCYDIVS